MINAELGTEKVKTEEEQEQEPQYSHEHDPNTNIVSSRSRGNFVFSKPKPNLTTRNLTSDTPNKASKINKEEKTVENPNRLYPLPIPFLNPPTPLSPAFATLTPTTTSTIETTTATLVINAGNEKDTSREEESKNEDKTSTFILNGTSLQPASTQLAVETPSKNIITSKSTILQTLPPNIVIANATPTPKSEQSTVTSNDRTIERLELESDPTDPGNLNSVQSSHSTHETNNYDR